MPYGRGITALFSGQPGTGKTMAAQATANALNRIIYSVDLAQLPSKYIGETNKNFEIVFTEAERSGSPDRLFLPPPKSRSSPATQFCPP